MIYLIVGASGSGKSTIGKILEEQGIPQLVSFTTRQKRKGEIDGQDYHFITQEKLEALSKKSIAEITEYNGNYYGLTKREVSDKLDEFREVYFVTNEDGAKQIIDMYPEDTVVFWLNVTIETMVERMRVRGDKEEDNLSRIDHAIDNKEIFPPKSIEKYLYILDADNTPEELSGEIIDKIYDFEMEKDYTWISPGGL